MKKRTKPRKPRKLDHRTLREVRGAVGLPELGIVVQLETPAPGMEAQHNEALVRI